MLKSVFKGFSGEKKKTINDPILAYVTDACNRIDARSALKQKIQDTSFCAVSYTHLTLPTICSV